MKNQQEKNPLEQPDYSANIYETIKLLEYQLNVYRQSTLRRGNSYRIHQEFDMIKRELSGLRFRIENLTSI